MEFLSSLFYFIIIIGVLVLIHEFGHFIAARMSGMRTEIFSIGMGHRILGFHKKYGFTFGALPKKKDEEENLEVTNIDSDDESKYCDYRLSMFPIGGYVKISGMIDESMDTEFTKSESKPWEFRSKNPFIKAWVISAGVIMNFVLAFAIFSGNLFFTGESVYKTTKIGSVLNESLAEDIGLQKGDKILSINGKDVTDWNDLFYKLNLEDFGDERIIRVKRNNDEITLKADGRAVIKSMVEKEQFGILPDYFKTYVTDVLTTYPAGKSGIIKGDTIISVNDKKVNSIYEFTSLVKANKDVDIKVEIKRNNQLISKIVKPNKDGVIGVSIQDYYYGPKSQKQYGVVEASIGGWNQMISMVDLFFTNIKQIFAGNISIKQSIGGPIKIAKGASDQAKLGASSFLNFMALLSISLAIINILPFPALDGGHLVIIIIEGILKREISVKLKMGIQQAGFILLLLLMVFILYNDIVS